MLLPALLLVGGGAQAGTITLMIDNVRNATGTVHADICPEAGFLKENCVHSGEAPAHPGMTIVRVANVPAGRYAAQISHDENGNHRVDRGLFGIPKEGIAFSNDAPVRFGPPAFAAAAFAVTPADQAIRVRMRYFTGAAGPPRR